MLKAKKNLENEHFFIIFAVGKPGNRRGQQQWRSVTAKTKKKRDSY